MSDKSNRTTGARKLYNFDNDFLSKKDDFAMAGIDEAGRGPLAGPVVAAAVILNPSDIIEGINDSKKLKETVRDQLYSQITQRALSWSVGIASSEEIDKINILQATFKAMGRAIENLSIPWDYLFVDGNQLIPNFPKEKQKTIVGGDGLSASIAAASILAKVTRDRMMFEYNEKYPMYGFDRNKGYGTAEHINQIGSCGISPVHRRTFCDHFFIQTKLDLF